MIHISILPQGGAFATVDVQMWEAVHVWERDKGRRNSSLSVLLPAAPTDLEEQVKGYPSACLQPLALVSVLSAHSWVQIIYLSQKEV